MRDKRFVAEHMGRPLNKGCHRQLMKWACVCSEHVLPFMRGTVDERLIYALEVAKSWELGNVSTGDARKAALGAIDAAREAADQTEAAIARSIGHTAATAHMADHSLGAAWYALKAVKMAGGSPGDERKWQYGQLPPAIRELVITAMDTGRFKIK